MSYPKWLEDENGWNTDYSTACKLVRMAKDAWDILYNHGIDGGMPIEEFFGEYGDKPYVDLDQLNGGTGI
jgi:hypothetical protein